jgi:hypothetical protein
MEAGPRDVPPPDHGRGKTGELRGHPAVEGLGLDDLGARTEPAEPGDLTGLTGPADPDGIAGLGEPGLPEGEDPDAADVPGAPAAAVESFRELRPQRRLRIWQLAPIVALATLGSLMFAFPLAFEFGDGGAMVGMLGLLLCCCSAGWGIMAARRVGHTWPGLPRHGSGERPDWRFVALYAVLTAVLAVLAVWRVTRLR